MKREINLNRWGKGRRRNASRLFAEACDIMGVSQEAKRKALFEIEMSARRESYEFIRQYGQLFEAIRSRVAGGMKTEDILAQFPRANGLARHRIRQCAEYLRLEQEKNR